MILTTFFTLLSDPSKWVWPRLAKNLNCKYNYLIPRIQLSRKNWVGRSLGLNKWGLRRKIARFFEFRHLMSHRGKGVPHIGKFCIPNNSLWFVLSFKPLNGVLAPPSCEKTQFFFQNFQLQSALTPEFATRWEVPPIWACSAWRVLSEYHSHTPGSFLELDPLPPWTKFQGVNQIIKFPTV